MSSPKDDSGSVRQKISEEAIHAFGLIELRPVSRSFEPLVAPGTIDEVLGAKHRRLFEIGVTIRPQTERRGFHRGNLRRRL